MELLFGLMVTEIVSVFIGLLLFILFYYFWEKYNWKFPNPRKMRVMGQKRVSFIVVDLILMVSLVLLFAMASSNYILEEILDELGKFSVVVVVSIGGIVVYRVFDIVMMIIHYHAASQD